MIIKLYIILTLVLHFISKKRNVELGLVLVLSVLNTLICTLLSHYKIATFFSNNIYIVLNTILWLMILYSIVKKKYIKALIFIYCGFVFGISVISNPFREFIYIFFIVGALVYVTLFWIECYHNLKNEKLSFFQTNDFILLFSPIMFFLGMSIVFGFKSHLLTITELWKGFNLYNFISYFVNIIYYSLINYYLYKINKDV
jgi:hypothetical protein